MAFQPAPDAAIVVLEFLLNGEIMQNSVHAFKPGGYSLADLQVLADIADGNVVASWLDEMSTDCLYVRTTVRGLAFENDQEAIQDQGSANGNIASDAFPGNVTVSIKRGTGLTGRSARGRLYWIGLARTQLQANDNFISQVTADALAFNLESMKGSISGTVWTAAVLSRVTNGAPRAEAKSFEWTTSTVVDLAVDSQRRRLTR